jgi:hypothetical protein
MHVNLFNKWNKMNLVKFDKMVGDIENICNSTNYNLKKQKYFTKHVRNRFNCALKIFFSLVTQDQLYLHDSHKLSHTVHRIIRLSQIHSKMTEIYLEIFNLNSAKYFFEEISQQVLPLLNHKLDELCFNVGTTNRLPFTVGIERENFYQEAKKSVEFTDSSQILTIEREYFHLLGNHLDSQKLTTIDINHYSGINEIFALLSWSNILHAFVEKGNQEEQNVGNLLIIKIQKALSLSNKLSFAYSLPDLKKTFSYELSYYNDLAELLKYKEIPNHRRALSESDFFSKYTLESTSPIPLKVVRNEMAWDIVEIVHQMKPGDFEIFVLGSQLHRVLIQITCLELASTTKPGNYKYEIFNTGNGIVLFHRVKQEIHEYWVQPLTFYYVPKYALNFNFFDSLIVLALCETNIDLFYSLHDTFLIHMGGAQKDFDSGSWYGAQKFGICSSACVETWIHSYFSEEQNKHLELIKTQKAIQKMSRVVALWEKEVLEKTSQQGIYASKNVAAQLMTETTKKLEDSQVLLKLGEEYLNALNSK